MPPSESQTAFITAAALLMHSVYSFSEQNLRQCPRRNVEDFAVLFIGETNGNAGVHVSGEINVADRSAINTLLPPSSS